jgi:hypothetical protein
MAACRDGSRIGRCIADFIMVLHANKKEAGHGRRKQQEGKIELILMSLEMCQ